MQYDLFHIYTVDEHTLFVIRNLRRFFARKTQGRLPFCNQIFLLIGKPELLYFAGLFHDIAKGQKRRPLDDRRRHRPEFCQATAVFPRTTPADPAGWYATT